MASVELTQKELWALGGSALAMSLRDDTLRDMPAADRAVALDMRTKANQLVEMSGLDPNDLKRLGLNLVAEAQHA